MVDERTKLRIAQVVGIHIHGVPPSVNYIEAVDPDSPALDAVVEVLTELQDRYALQFGRVQLGISGEEEAGDRVRSALRTARAELERLEHQRDEELRYAAGTAGQYLDRFLQR